MLNLIYRIFNFYIPFWILGLYIPYLYILLIVNFKYLLTKVKRDLILQSLLTFIIVYLISIFLSIFFIDINISYTRYIAAYHNIICWFYIALGYVLSQKTIFLHFFRRYLLFNSILLALISITSFLYSFINLQPIKFHNILYFLIHYENKYTITTIVEKGFITGLTIPRVQILGIYPNSAAIIMYIIFSLSLFYYRKSLIIRILLFLLFFISIFLTGSRIVLVIFIITSILLFIRSRILLVFLIIITIFLSFFFYQEIIKFIDFLQNLRESSNLMRLQIYKVTLSFLIEKKLYLGMGIKPHVISLGKYPLGSHSTFIGLIAKTGLFGFLFASIIYFIIVIFFFKTFLKKKITNSDYILYILFGLSIIYLFEDVDAYEFSAFLTGFLIGLWKISKYE